MEEFPPAEIEGDVEVSQETEIEEVPEGETVSLDDLKRGLQALVDAVPGLELEVEEGEEVEYNNLHIRIIEMRDLKIETVRVTRLATEGSAGNNAETNGTGNEPSG
jgi:CBS domain containing-hemolysin-like protein